MAKGKNEAEFAAFLVLNLIPSLERNLNTINTTTHPEAKKVVDIYKKCLRETVYKELGVLSYVENSTMLKILLASRHTST